MKALAALWTLLLFLATGSSRRFQYVKSKFFSTDSAITKQSNLNAARARVALDRYAGVVQAARRNRNAGKKQQQVESIFKTKAKAFALVGRRSAWADLREAAQRAEGGLRLPHPDIGFYNPQQYSYRLYMRIMADFFGIRGFCFYHYWSGDRPVRNRLLEMMLQDGEPNKPFFLCWDLSLGAGQDALEDTMAAASQGFSNATGNVGHYKYLHAYFRHPNYLKIHGRPVLGIKGVSAVEADAFDYLLKAWHGLAVQMGFKGMYFVRFIADVADENIVLRNVAAHVDIEPQRFLSGLLSMHRTSLSNSTAGNDNMTVALSPSSRSHGFSKEAAWESIENRYFYHTRNTFYSAFCNWNNMMDTRVDSASMIPQGVKGFEFHLKYMIDKTDADFSGFSEPLLLLSSWNDWSSQSAFEPNDSDGYDALMSLKKVAGILHEKIIIHVSNHGEDEIKDKYISDIMFMFMDYLHMAYSFSKIPSIRSLTDVLLLHVHDAMQGEEAPRWRILDFVRQYVAANISVCVTVHDYQYLYPDNPLPPLQAFTAWTPSAENIRNTRTLFDLATKVIFPSPAIQSYYTKYLWAPPGGGQESPPPAPVNIRTVPHMDTMVHSDCVRVPACSTGAISARVNAVLVSDELRPQELDLFFGLAKELQQFKDATGFFVSMSYTLFANSSDSYKLLRHSVDDSGATTANNNVVSLARALEDGVYLHESQQQYHILLSLSTYPDPYSYRLNKAINSGLPIVYLRPSSMAERIRENGEHSRHFPVVNAKLELIKQLKNAVKFVIKQGKIEGRKCSRSKNIQPSKWYMSHYPAFHGASSTEP